MASLARLAQILNNRTETVDDRIKDLKSFKTFIVKAQGTSADDTIIGNSTDTQLVADNNHDTLAIGSENKWIILKPNAGTDSFTIGHYKKAFIPTTSTADLNSTGTFDVISLSYDEAGHITAKDTKTFTLPYNYKTIALTNAESTAVSELTANAVSVVADTQTATITYVAGNKWLKFAGDNSTKTITFAHALSVLAAGAHASTFQQEAQTPAFGANFNVLIPTISFTTDEAGHVTAYSYTSTNAIITIPKGSLITDTTENVGNVITNIDFVDTTGQITRHFKYISNLALTDYNAPNLPDGYVASTAVGTKKVYSSIAATQTLKEALAQLQSYSYNNQVMIDDHVADTENPHNVTKTQVGLGNVDDVQQIQALSGTLDANNVGHIALWASNNTLSISQYTIAASVPANAVFTDTTYEQATDTTLGLVKLYDTTGDNADGTMTQEAIQTAIQEAVEQGVQSVLDNFGVMLAMPTTATWSVDPETNELSVAVDPDIEDVVITIEQFVDDEWIEAADLTAARTEGDRFRAYGTRTLTVGSKTYSNEGQIGDEYVEPAPPTEPEPGSDPEENP